VKASKAAKKATSAAKTAADKAAAIKKAAKKKSATPAGEKRLCFNFRDNGSCDRGNDCRYFHIPTGSTSVALSNNDYQEASIHALSAATPSQRAAAQSQATRIMTEASGKPLLQAVLKASFSQGWSSVCRHDPTGYGSGRS
jgi:hypothetical protein